MAAPKTVLTYPLDGSNRDFTIPFEYLARKFVVVTLVGKTRQVLVPTSEYRFATNTTITTTKAWGPGDSFENVEIRRVTSATERLVDFSDGSILRAYDLNTAQVQSLHIAEEARDLTADTIAVNNDGDLDARGRKLVNLADGAGPGDAVTVRQQLANADSAMASAVRAKTSETNAKAFESTALGAMNTATQKAVDSADSAEKARIEAVKAKSATDTIGTSVADAALSASKAKASEDGAKVSEGKAAISEINAKTSESSAKVSADTANTAGLQLGMSQWGYRSQPFKGFAPDDGQELERALYPDFAAALDAGLLPTVSQSVWSADPRQRGSFVANSSAGKFRMRDLNGAQAGSVQGLFLRGGTSVSPAIRQDQFQDHAHSVPLHVADSASRGQLSTEFAYNPTVLDGAKGNILTGASWVTSTGRWAAGTGKTLLEVSGTNGAPRVGAETSPCQVTGAWMTRLFGVITPLGAADASSLATAYASLASRVTTNESAIMALDSRLQSPSAPQYIKESLWTGSIGSPVVVTMTRNINPGETLLFKHNDANSLTATAQVPFDLSINRRCGATITSVHTGFYANYGGNRAVIYVDSYTAGYGISEIYTMHRKY